MKALFLFAAMMIAFIGVIGLGAALVFGGCGQYALAMVATLVSCACMLLGMLASDRIATMI